MELEKILPNNGPSIDEVKKYTTKYSNDIIVIKCGGSVLLEKNLFNQFIEDISVINKLGLSVVVVHGGGKNIQKKLDEHNLKSAFIDGLRVTDEKTIKIVEEALLELNFEILSEISNHHANSVSISPKKNNVIRVTPERKELGFVGTPTEIKKDIILEVEGVLDKSKNLISEINSSMANEMLENKTIAGGMIPKIKTCLDAVNNGVTGVVIVDGRKQHSILFEIFSDKGAGTLIRK